MNIRDMTPEQRSQFSALGGKKSKGKPKSEEHKAKIKAAYWKRQEGK